jgi:hypothetical protein
MNRILVFIIYLFLYACANIGSPSGGPKDETPPKLDTLRSTTNFQTNFEIQRITLVFDEFVDLKDVFNQVVVSPPLAKRPTVTKKKRSIRFDFDKDEILRQEATYTINFGEAVRDFTEGNAVPDLRFIFSTGDFIDSLEVRGKITDALTGEPAEDVLLMLYDNLSDTVVRTERPFYFAKSGEDGQFIIGNVKSDTFKVFALFDSNLNYRYDQEGELIGFPDENIVLSGDSNLILPTISLFQENPPLKIMSKKPQSGRIKLAFNQTPEDLNFTYDADIDKVSYEYELDTINVWYDWEGEKDWQLFVNKDTSFFDTIDVKMVEKEEFLNKRKLKLVSNQRKNQLNKFNPTQTIKLKLNHPIASIDSSKIYFFEDSTFTPVYPLVSFEERELRLKYPWKEDSLYQLQILPDGLTDIYGLKNTDTINQQYKALALKEFGNIILTINGLDSLKSYVVQLFSEKNGILVKEIAIKEVKEFKQNYNTLSPGKYEVRIITDLNENGRWDTGNYDRKIQPEPIFTVKTKELRANWDNEEEITLIE